MNKKLLLTFVALGLMYGLAVADNEHRVPVAQTGDILQVGEGYGGMLYSTSSFSVSFNTVTVTGGAIFAGVQFSSGNLASYDFIDVWDATSTVNTVGAPQMRVYNVTGSTITGSAAVNAGAASGWNGPKYPWKLKFGMIWKASSAAYNSIVVQFWKPD